jgi:enoyl-CoA hydratase
VNTLVNYQLANSVATIRMDDGKANVMSLRMLAELNRALDQAVADQAVVLLAGREGMFSAGFDLTILKAGGPDATAMIMSGFQLAARLLAFPTPVVIACTGHALAMGVFLVLSADYRIGADGPFKIGANEVAIGLTMPHFAIELCRQRLAPSQFNRALINAEIFAPHQAVSAGFIDQVTSAAELLSVAQGKAAELSKLNMPAHAATKLRVREPVLTAIRKAIALDAQNRSHN